MTVLAIFVLAVAAVHLAVSIAMVQHSKDRKP